MNNSNNNKRKEGLIISLPSGALSEMEKKREEILLQRRQREQVVQVENHSYDDDDEQRSYLSDNKYYSHEDEDEDDEIIPFQPIAQKGDDEFSDDDQQSSQTTEEKQKVEKQVDDNDDDDDDDEESVLSLTAPETKPIIIVNFEKLCGFTPPNEEEAHILKTQIFAELLGKKHTQKANEKENDNLGDGLSLEFVERSTSLFESGSAIHASIQNYNNDDDDKHEKKKAVIDLLNEYDTENHQTNLLNTKKTDNKDDCNEILLRYCIIPYPEFIFYNNKNNNNDNNKAENENDSVISVEQAWKTLLKKSSPTSTSSPPVIHKIMNLLKDTSRSLIWKYEMCLELSRIQKEEFHRKTKREQRKALKQWKQITRPNQLEQLYNVRETFELQKEKAHERLLDFEYERDVKVKEQMRLYYKQNNKNNVMNNQEDVDDVMLEMGDGKLIQSSANITSLDNDDDIFQYASSDQNDDDYLHQDMSDEDSEYHESFGESTDNDDDDSIDSFINQTNTETQSQTKDQSHVLIPTLPSTTHSKARLQRRKLKLKKKRKLQLFQQKQQQKQFLREQAKQHKIKLEEQNTSTQMKMAQMIHFTLSTKLNKIDELLESLQEEEWEDEEQKEIQELKRKMKMDTIDDDDENTTSSSDDEDDEEFSLLDAILAMILGGLPRKASFTQQDHFQMIQQTHYEIIEEWKETFGKLPRNPTTSATGSAGNKQKKKNTKNTNTVENDLSLQFQQNVTLNHNDTGKESLQAKRSALGIFDNDADDWDEFTDWDTLMPSFDITQIKEEEHTRDKELKISTTKKEEETKKPQQQQQRVGLRPGGKIQ